MKPYAEYKFQMDMQLAVQAAEMKVRPTIPSSCPAPVRELIERYLGLRFSMIKDP